MLIVTDGAVDIPDDLMTSNLVAQVPGEIWGADGPLEVDREEFWAGLRRGEYPSTSPPTVNALMSAYQHPDLVIALHVSGQLSATMHRAHEAAERVGSGVSVIDTGSLSVGAGLDRVRSAPSGEKRVRAVAGRLGTLAPVAVAHVRARPRRRRASAQRPIGALAGLTLGPQPSDGARHPRPCRALGTAQDNAAAPSPNWPDTCGTGPVQTLGPGLSATGTRPTSARS